MTPSGLVLTSLSSGNNNPSCEVLRRIAQEEHLQRRQLLETRRMAKCYLNYISNHRDQVQPLFELLTVVSHKTRCDYTFVKDFYVDLVADQYTVEEKQRVSGMLQCSCAALCQTCETLVAGTTIVPMCLNMRYCPAG